MKQSLLSPRFLPFHWARGTQWALQQRGPPLKRRCCTLVTRNRTTLSSNKMSKVLGPNKHTQEPVCTRGNLKEFVRISCRNTELLTLMMGIVRCVTFQQLWPQLACSTGSLEGLLRYSWDMVTKEKSDKLIFSQADPCIETVQVPRPHGSSLVPTATLTQGTERLDTNDSRNKSRNGETSHTIADLLIDATMACLIAFIAVRFKKTMKSFVKRRGSNECSLRKESLTECTQVTNTRVGGQPCSTSLANKKNTQTYPID